MSSRQYVIPTLPGMGRGLVNHDERSKAYRATVRVDTAKPRTRGWRRGAAYDQGRTSECVANTGKGILNTADMSAAVPWAVRSRYDRHAFYVGAQQHDQWDGEAYDGTSALGLCRYLAQIGIIGTYRWCFGLDDVLLTLSYVGPVGIGIGWREGMWEPDSDGLIHATGDVVGGHEVELTGVDVKARTVVLTNSWGVEWGRNGRACLSWDDLGMLLADDGDAVAITS